MEDQEYQRNRRTVNIQLGVAGVTDSTIGMRTNWYFLGKADQEHVDDKKNLPGCQNPEGLILIQNQFSMTSGSGLKDLVNPCKVQYVINNPFRWNLTIRV